METQDGRSEVTLTVAEAAAATGLSEKALRRRIERGSLRAVLVGGRRRIPLSELIRAHLVVTTPPAPTAQTAASPPAGHDDPLRELGDALEARSVIRELLDRIERQSAELARIRLAAAHAERRREAEVAALRRELELARNGRRTQA